VAFVASFVSKLSDTVSSEIGKVSVHPVPLDIHICGPAAGMSSDSLVEHVPLLCE